MIDAAEKSSVPRGERSLLVALCWMIGSAVAIVAGFLLLLEVLGEKPTPADLECPPGALEQVLENLATEFAAGFSSADVESVATSMGLLEAGQHESFVFEQAQLRGDRARRLSFRIERKPGGSFALWVDHYQDPWLGPQVASLLRKHAASACAEAESR